MPASNAQPLNTMHYAQPIAYAEPQVQVVAVSQSSWGWSDLALLAVAGAIVGAAVTSHSQGYKAQKSVVELVEDADEEALATIAAIAASRAQTRRVAKTRSGRVQMFSEGDIGVLPPLGVYDPLGLIETRDMRRYEIMEIKHGRAAMLGF